MDNLTLNRTNHYGVGKTYSSSNEAFKDGDYAVAIWDLETSAEKIQRVSINFINFGFVAVVIVSGIYYLINLIK